MIAILRAKNAAMAVARGVELADMGNICSAACAMQWRSGVMFRRTLLGAGCKALEVTLDSVGFEGIVQQLVSSIGDRCCVGAGTVVTLDEVSKPGSEPMSKSRGVRSGTPPSDTKAPPPAPPSGCVLYSFVALPRLAAVLRCHQCVPMQALISSPNATSGACWRCPPRTVPR